MCVVDRPSDRNYKIRKFKNTYTQDNKQLFQIIGHSNTRCNAIKYRSFYLRRVVSRLKQILKHQRGLLPDCKVLFLREEQKNSSDFLRGSGTETSVSKPAQTDT